MSELSRTNDILEEKICKDCIVQPCCSKACEKFKLMWMEILSSENPNLLEFLKKALELDKDEVQTIGDVLIYTEEVKREYNEYIKDME